MLITCKYYQGDQNIQGRDQFSQKTSPPSARVPLRYFPVFYLRYITEYIDRGHSTVDNLVGYSIWGAVVTEVQVR